MDIRPIDANALEELFNKQIELGATDAFGAFDDALQDTPTLRCEECPNYDAAFDCRPSCPNCERTLSLNTLRDAIYQDAVAHGLWEKTEQDAEKLLEESEKDKEKGIQFFRKVAATELVLDEAEELFSDAWRENHDNMIEELADVVIQAFSTAGYLGIDIDAAIRRKMEINKNRPWKHGKP